jgi:hypothetical protein
LNVSSSVVHKYIKQKLLVLNGLYQIESPMMKNF